MGAPPQIPDIPTLDPKLAEYLRRLSLWCQNNFNTSIQTNSAATGLLMQSTTADTVWKVTISDAGVLQTTQLTPGARP
jgi:hypothetical protein